MFRVGPGVKQGETVEKLGNSEFFTARVNRTRHDSYRNTNIDTYG